MYAYTFEENNSCGTGVGSVLIQTSTCQKFISFKFQATQETAARCLSISDSTPFLPGTDATSNACSTTHLLARASGWNSDMTGSTSDSYTDQHEYLWLHIVHYLDPQTLLHRIAVLLPHFTAFSIFTMVPWSPLYRASRSACWLFRSHTLWMRLCDYKVLGSVKPQRNRENFADIPHKD